MGYPPNFIRWEMTLRDFKTAALSAMKDKIEEQRNISIAVGIAIASAFDAKAVEPTNTAISKMLGEIDRQQEDLYGENGRPQAGNVIRKASEPKHDESGLETKAVNTWKALSQIDSFYTKMTGRMTGAPWSKANQGNREQGMDFFKSAADNITGKDIMSAVERGAQREGRMRPGRRR